MIKVYLLKRTVIQNGNEINPTIISETAKLITKKFVLVLKRRGPVKYARITIAFPSIIINVIIDNNIISNLDGVTFSEILLCGVVLLHVTFAVTFVVTFDVMFDVMCVMLIFDIEQFCIFYFFVF